MHFQEMNSYLGSEGDVAFPSTGEGELTWAASPLQATAETVRHPGDTREG